MATKTDGTRQLNSVQERALELLLSGKTVTDTAKEVGVSRQTVSTWLNHDPVFKAELNHRRCELWDGVKQRLTQLAVLAVDVLEESLYSSDPRVRLHAAIHVLKALRLYGDHYHPHGPTTPEGVAEERRWTVYWARPLGKVLEDSQQGRA